MHALRLGVERVVAARLVVVPDAGARLHRHGRDAVDHQTMTHDVVRTREGRIGCGLVAREVNEADVVRAIVPDPRPPGRHGIGSRGHRRQRFVVDLDQLGGVGRLCVSLRNHKCDVISDPAHTLLHQCGVRRAIHRTAVAAVLPAWHRKIAPAEALPVGTR